MRILVLGLLLSAVAMAEWPQFRGNASLTGVATGGAAARESETAVDVGGGASRLNRHR
jgi:hypothetical protein